VKLGRSSCRARGSKANIRHYSNFELSQIVEFEDAF